MGLKLNQFNKGFIGKDREIYRKLLELLPSRSCYMKSGLGNVRLFDSFSICFIPLITIGSFVYAAIGLSQAQ